MSRAAEVTATLDDEKIEEMRHTIKCGTSNLWTEAKVRESWHASIDALCDLALSALASPPGAPVAYLVIAKDGGQKHLLWVQEPGVLPEEFDAWVAARYSSITPIYASPTSPPAQEGKPVHSIVMRIKQQRDRVADALRAIRPDHPGLEGIPTAEQRLANIMQVMDAEPAPTPPSEKERERLADHDFAQAYQRMWKKLDATDHYTLSVTMQMAKAAGVIRQADAPVGWVSVPVEPTPEMVAAYLKAQRDDCEAQDRSIGALLPGGVQRAFKAGYRALLAAIPRHAGSAE